MTDLDLAAAPPARRAGARSAWPAAGIAVLVLAAVGVPYGVLWGALAPRVGFERTATGLRFLEENPQQYIAADAVFTLIGLGVGVAAALIAWFAARRARGPIMLAGLTLGSIACQTVAWRFGRLGREEYAAAVEHMRPGWTFWRASELLAVRFEPAQAWQAWTSGQIGEGFSHLSLGALATTAFAAVFVYTVFVGWSRSPDLRPVPSESAVFSDTDGPHSGNEAEDAPPRPLSS